MLRLHRNRPGGVHPSALPPRNMTLEAGQRSMRGDPVTAGRFCRRRTGQWKRAGVPGRRGRAADAEAGRGGPHHHAAHPAQRPRQGRRQGDQAHQVPVRRPARAVHARGRDDPPRPLARRHHPGRGDPGLRHAAGRATTPSTRRAPRCWRPPSGSRRWRRSPRSASSCCSSAACARSATPSTPATGDPPTGRRPSSRLTCPAGDPRPTRTRLIGPVDRGATLEDTASLDDPRRRRPRDAARSPDGPRRVLPPLADLRRLRPGAGGVRPLRHPADTAPRGVRGRGGRHGLRRAAGRRAPRRPRRRRWR